MRRWIGVMPLVLLAFLTVGCRRHAPAGNAGDMRGYTETSGRQGTDKGKGPIHAEDLRRYTEASGGFSFIPPEGWQVRDFPGRKFKVVVGPATAGFAANINIVDELFNGSLEDYAKTALKALPRVLKKVRLVKQDDFVTVAGLQSVRAIVEDEQNSKLLRQTFYFFSNKNTKFTITCTALAEGGDKLDSAFEASMKTFRFDAQ